MKDHPLNSKEGSQKNEREIQALLKREFVRMQDVELRRDLWPQMLRRLSAQPLHVPWFDWALVVVLVGALLFFPGTIPTLLYHL